MAKITKPLTDTEIKNAKPKDKPYKLFDGDGLVLKVLTSGSKTWLLIYKQPFTKKRTEMVLGKYPSLNLSDARKLREDNLSLIANDKDPKEEKQAKAISKAESLSNTLYEVSKSWYEVKSSKIKEETAKDLWRSLELHVFPNMGKLPISKITAPLTIQHLKPIAAKGTLETVKRISQRLNEIMTYAVNTGVIHANPLAGIKSAFQKPVKTNMPTISPDELPAFLKDFQHASIKLVTRYLVEFQLHTMTRPNETAGARWQEIDLDNGLWVIPADRMKKGKEHVIPLTAQTIEILERIKPISGHREFIFPANSDPKKHIHTQTANATIKRMGYKGKLVSHGLRALASTTLNEQGFDPDVIESALAHVDKNEVRRAYNRAEYLERRRVMMIWWSNHIEQAKTGKTNLNTGNQAIRIVSNG